MPAAPRLARASPGADAVRQEIEALRLIVSRPALAAALWGRETRKATHAALLAAHGTAAIVSHKVTRQALSTAVSTVNEIFAKDFDLLDARQVIDMVALVLSFDLNKDAFDAKLQRALLIAAVHAALRLLPGLDRADVKDTYRWLVDLVRDDAWTAADEVASIKDVGVDRIKAVVRAIYNLEEDMESRLVWKAVQPETREFHKHFPVPKLQEMLQEHAHRIKTSLSPLWVLVPHDQQVHRARRGKRPSNGGGGKRRSVNDPDFFSDVEEVGETIGREAEDSWQTHVLIKVEQNAFSPMHTDESEDEREESHVHDDDNTESAALNEEPPRHLSKKRGRSSADAPVQAQRPRRRSRRAPVEEEEKEEEENRRNLRPRRVPRGSYNEEDNDLDYIESESDSLREFLLEASSDEFNWDISTAAVDGVARHARTRPQGRKGKRSGRTKSRSPYVTDKQAANDVQESPPNGAAQSDQEETDSDRGEIERSRVPGQAGEALRGLHDAAAHLKNSGMPDPLQASVRDAQGAKHRARRSLVMRYSPDVNARAASPIPGSETPIQRKRRTNVELEETESSEEERAVARGSMFQGRILRTGRFQIYEDDLLVAGLQNFGWGMWTLIAKNFGTGKYTRAPMSLKDRARTMGLDPLKYPVPKNSSVKKKGRPSFRAQLGGQRRQSANAERIESPSGSENTHA